MYYNDINVTIQEAFEPSVGLINRAFLVTHEAVIPFTKLSGANAVAELDALLLAGTLTAPLLKQAVAVLVSQTDSSGNPLFPDYIYIGGAVVADYASATDLTGLIDLITDYAIATNLVGATSITFLTDLITAYASGTDLTDLITAYESLFGSTDLITYYASLTDSTGYLSTTDLIDFIAYHESKGGLTDLIDLITDYASATGLTDNASATDVSDLTDLITANTTVESDFWGIIPVKYNLKLVEWLATFCASKQKAFFVDIESKNFTITDTQKSARGYMIYNGRTGDQANQQFSAGVYGRCFSGESLVGVKFKTVTGISSYKQDTLSDSEVSTLATNGVNTYLYRYGKGSIDGSFTTDSDGNLKAVNHIDEMYIRDNIKYNLIKNIYLWLNSSEMASMSDYAELESVVTSVLSTFADDGFIATIEGLKQFSVNVPIPSSSDRNERLLEGIFKYIPNGAVEWVTITGQEVFDIINGEEV